MHDRCLESGYGNGVAFQVSRTTRMTGTRRNPVLVDGDFHGEPKKMLMQTSRNGYFFVLDRTNGKNLLTAPFGL
jgi:alcohol dehydrogenase (cytochrome c)